MSVGGTMSVMVICLEVSGWREPSRLPDHIPGLRDRCGPQDFGIRHCSLLPEDCLRLAATEPAAGGPGPQRFQFRSVGELVSLGLLSLPLRAGNALEVRRV